MYKKNKKNLVDHVVDSNKHSVIDWLAEVTWFLYQPIRKVNFSKQKYIKIKK